MKFANYIFYARGVNNLGDNMQIIAIDNIYESMGIEKKNIVYINKNDLDKYYGEYVILPITMPLVDYIEGGISGRFSKYIIPVFLGFTMVTDKLIPQEIQYLKQYEPIGCRDERTMNTLRTYGINSYLHGCVTAALPNRDIAINNFNKIFIVDAPTELMEYVPEEIKDKAIYLSHMISEELDNPKALANEFYNRYKSEGALVITSLLHCAVPCMAAGIPVILAKTKISYRFGWLEKLISIYDEENFKNIDWNPKSVQYDLIKDKILQVSIERLKDTYDKYSNIYDLSWFYENRDKKVYVNDSFESIKQYIDRKFQDKFGEYKYSIWGLSQISVVTVNYISKNYPNAKLLHVYDEYRKISFEGIISESPENIKKYPKDIIFITTNGAKKMALDLFSKIDKEIDTYVFYEPIK